MFFWLNLVQEARESSSELILSLEEKHRNKQWSGGGITRVWGKQQERAFNSTSCRRDLSELHYFIYLNHDFEYIRNKMNISGISKPQNVITFYNCKSQCSCLKPLHFIIWWTRLTLNLIASHNGACDPELFRGKFHFLSNHRWTPRIKTSYKSGRTKQQIKRCDSRLEAWLWTPPYV